MNKILQTLVYILFFMPVFAYAHASSEAYLQLQFHEKIAKGSMEYSLVDLEHSIGIDADGDGEISWTDINKRNTALQEYIQSGVKVTQNAVSCPLSIEQMMLSDTHGSIMLYVPFHAVCASDIGSVEFKYNLFFEEDVHHHAILTLVQKDKTLSRIIANDNRKIMIDFYNQDSKDGFFEFLIQGIWHIWFGLDHVFFVILLIISVDNSLVQLSAEGKKSQRKWRALKTVTGFSIAHSITLTAAVFNWMTLPSSWVESIIALSVILAGLNVIFKWFAERLWLFAFCFGLLHGFGFASVLQNLGLAQTDMLLSLVAFNLGVEAGQLLIVLVILPLIITVGKMNTVGLYIKQLLASGVVTLASVWFLQRISL